MDKNSLSIITENQSWTQNICFIDIFNYIANTIIKKKCQATLLLTDNKKIKQLNNDFRKINKPTNVLSFPNYVSIDNIKCKPLYLGDIAMAYEFIKEEAEYYNIPFKNRAMHLFAHGVLHLIGMDHIEEKDRLRMEALEIEILKEFGITNPYIC